MQKTHFERFKSSPFWYLFEDQFKQCEMFDTNKYPISEVALYKVFAQNSTNSSLDLSLAMHLYHAWKDGNFYELTPALCDVLTKTEYRDVDTRFIRVPERSMYLSLPKGNGLVVPCNQTGRLHNAEGIYLTFLEFEQPSTILLGKQHREIKDVIKHISVMVVGEEIGLHNDALIYFNLCFWQGKVSDSIEKNIEMTIGFNNDILVYIRQAFNLIAKVLLYIECSNTVLKQIAGVDINSILAKKKNKSKIRKQFKKLDRLSVLLHKQIDVTTINKHSSSSSSGVETGRKVLLESVAPHFKMQHFGPQNTLVKIIHVDGYERGELAGQIKSTKKKHLIK